MANGLDKLERLFSTKKRAAASRHTAEANIYGSVSSASAPDPHQEEYTRSHPYQPETPPSFPQTPFIRPKPNMMQPRNELQISSPASLARTNSSRTNSTRSQRLSQVPSVGAKSDEMNDRRQSSYSTTASFHIPSRNSSLLSRRHDKIPGGLIQLHLPRETAFADDSIHSSFFPDARSFPLKEATPLEGAQKGLLDALPIYPSSRVETPPPSDQDDFTFPSPPERGRKLSTKLAQLQLTPEPSPDMIPQRDSPLSEPKSSTEIKRATASAPPSRRATASNVPLLDDDWRNSYVKVSEDTVSPKSRPVFHEYPVEDFLNMTDEDLAEVKIVHPSKPPSKRAPPPPILSPTSRSGSFASIMRSPVPASPAMASSQVAAWEAARIAKKYDFDVVYIANFGPSRVNHLHQPRQSHFPASACSSAPSSFSQSLPASMLSSPTTDHPSSATHSSTPRHSLQSHTTTASTIHFPPADIFATSPTSPSTTAPTPTIRDCCPNSAVPCHAPRGLSGALLAAYGLETIQAPFRLNTTVHKKILRTSGWIEHRNSAAAANEFARGYARSFHTGGSAPATPLMFRRASSPDVSRHGGAAKDLGGGGGGNTSKKKKKKTTSGINRGIVFVAYRRTRGPGGAVNSSAAELDALEKEAETLVELILDFHRERRRWETLQERRRASEGEVVVPA